MRILITGSRKWPVAHSGIIAHAILEAAAGVPTHSVTVVDGTANGADEIAHCIAKGFGYHTERHPADWDEHGRTAGSIRNSRMVDLGADVCLAFPMPGSIGTYDCMRKAKAAGIPVREFRL